jgi:hypothetical protein
MVRRYETIFEAMALNAGMPTKRELATKAASELLLRELYVDLRQRISKWSEVTRQTPQARMGYIGQHLASVVTGFPGSRSGARGKDLILPEGKFAEIKTCYRIDQLGGCASCSAAVSSIEYECPECHEKEIVRRDDSKWLIGIRNDEEMKQLFEPESYYLVLFDFAAVEAAERLEAVQDDPDPAAETAVEVVTDQPLDINARIWKIDPRHPGFAYCMVDYYVNIRTKSKSKAPFNLWPYSLKFQVMSPLLIYHAIIRANDTIATVLFPGAGDPVRYPISPFPNMHGSRRNLSDLKLREFAKSQGLALPAGMSRGALLQELEKLRQAKRWDNEWLAHQLSEALYSAGVRGHEEWLP